MAYCPQCKAEMAMMDTACKACGYDFPQAAAKPQPHTGWEHGAFADASLLIGAFACLLAAIVTAGISFFTLFEQPLNGALGILYALTLHGVFVALLRVRGK